MKFKELMKKGRWSTRLLGKAMGKSYTTVCAWCTGSIFKRRIRGIYSI